MALPATDPEERLLALLAGMEPLLLSTLERSIARARAQFSIAEIVDLLEAGRLDEAVTAVSRTAVVPLADGTAAVFTLAGQAGAEFLTDALEVTVGFDQVNSRAVRTMQEDRLRLIREFTAEQRMATRDAIVDGIRRGLNPVEQARNFRGSIGLTARQQASVENYRRLLESGTTEALNRRLRDRRFDPAVRRAAREDRPLTGAQVDRMTERYRERMVAFRSRTIARTEALRSVHAGNDEAFRQAIDEGNVAADQLQRTWVTAGDERVRGSHVGLNGTMRGIDETFPGAAGPLRFPGDPAAPASETVQCRCALSTRIDPVSV